MIGLSKPLSVTILAAAALLGGAPPGVQAQVRRFPMQHGMMMMPMQQNLTTMQAANLAMFNSMRPVFHHHHWMSPFQSSRMMGANNPYSTMAMLGGLYGMGYGGYSMPYGLGSYGNSYAGAYGGAYANPNGYSSGRAERDYAPATEEKPPRPEVDPLEQSLNNASMADIMSGRALNIILADLRQLAAEDGPAGLPLLDIPMPETALPNINVTQGNGNIGILRSGAHFAWPIALSGPEFQEQRARLTSQAQAAVDQARSSGRVDAKTIVDMNANVDDLRQQIKPLALPFDQYLEAKNFLKNLDAAMVALQQPDAAFHFTGKYTLKAEGVPQLVKLMTDNGLQFAPAISGDEAAYSALYQALATFDRVVRADRKNGQ